MRSAPGCPADDSLSGQIAADNDFAIGDLEVGRKQRVARRISHHEEVRSVGFEARVFLVLWTSGDVHRVAAES